MLLILIFQGLQNRRGCIENGIGYQGRRSLWIGLFFRSTGWPENDIWAQLCSMAPIKELRITHQMGIWEV